MMNWTDTLAELICRTTSDLPADVEAALPVHPQTHLWRLRPSRLSPMMS